jgi:hypothetical protein
MLTILQFDPFTIAVFFKLEYNYEKVKKENKRYNGLNNTLIQYLSNQITLFALIIVVPIIFSTFFPWNWIPSRHPYLWPIPLDSPFPLIIVVHITYNIFTYVVLLTLLDTLIWHLPPWFSLIALIAMIYITLWTHCPFQAPPLSTWPKLTPNTCRPKLDRTRPNLSISRTKSSRNFP